MCNDRENFLPVASPWQIVNIPNGCSAYSPSLRIPAYTMLEQTQNKPFNRRYTGFNRTYVKLTDFRLMKDIPILDLNSHQLAHQADQLPPLRNVMEGRVLAAVEQINDSYPWTMPGWLEILISVLGTSIGMILCGSCIFCCAYRYTSSPKLPPAAVPYVSPPITTTIKQPTMSPKVHHSTATYRTKGNDEKQPIMQSPRQKK